MFDDCKMPVSCQKLYSKGYYLLTICLFMMPQSPIGNTTVCPQAYAVCDDFGDLILTTRWR